MPFFRIVDLCWRRLLFVAVQFSFSIPIRLSSTVHRPSLCVQQTDTGFVERSASFTLRSTDTRYQKIGYPFDLDSRFFVLSEQML